MTRFTYSRRKSYSNLTDVEAAQDRNEIEEYVNSSDDLVELLRMALSDIHFSGDTDLPLLYLPKISEGDNVLFDETTLNNISGEGDDLSGRSYDAYLKQVAIEKLNK